MTMDYISTRGRAPRRDFAEVALEGLAPDGGLYVPGHFPRLDSTRLAREGYVEAAWHVMSPFTDGSIYPSDLVKLLNATYGAFSDKGVAPLHMLADNLYIMELFHGPTLAFKDVAMQFLGQVFDHLLAREHRRVTIVGATSGDTGSAAIEAFRNKDTADIFILHPKGRVSDVQRRQMTTVDAPNVFNIAIEGSFDDCQDIVKALFADTKFRDDVQMSAVNSINWARVLAQVVYYAHAASQLHAKTGSKVTFCVPTGNFGNVYAGYVARAMGAPIDRLIVATNSNDILHRFFDTGRMQAEKVTPTLSPSMDIQISSNFERLMFDLLDRNGEQVESLLQGFRKTGELQFGAEVRKKAQAIFASGRQDDAETLDVMRRMYAERRYLVDPHTAVGLGVAESYLVNEAYEGEGRSLVVSLATAHPAKFPDAVKQATGVMPELPPHLADLHDRKERFTVLPNDVARVKDFVKANAGQGKSAIRA